MHRVSVHRPDFALSMVATLSGSSVIHYMSAGCRVHRARSAVSIRAPLPFTSTLASTLPNTTDGSDGRPQVPRMAPPRQAHAVETTRGPRRQSPARAQGQLQEPSSRGMQRSRGHEQAGVVVSLPLPLVLVSPLRFVVGRANGEDVPPLPADISFPHSATRAPDVNKTNTVRRRYAPRRVAGGYTRADVACVAAGRAAARGPAYPLY